ncbi:MAG: hypothetical protein JSU57_00780 [Candidatus Heimdallarchaeota archaeon]|nr:MAG: hypothetical protein JSU57_00780 [Candidatus Heimdallarchaeota archaeon]
MQQFSSNKTNYSCVDCDAALVTKSLEEIALEKARFLMDNQKLSRSGKFRPTLVQKKAGRSVESLSMLYDTKTTSAFHQSLITEMTRISGLSPQVISNFAQDFGIGENIISSLSGDNEEILLTLASVSPKFIEILHSILIGHDPEGLSIRFSVFTNNIGDIVFIQPSRSLVESGPYDLIAYDGQGMRIWVFCVKGTVDSKDIEKIVGPLLNQELSEFSGVSKICIVAQGFSWVALQILRKYRGIVVRGERGTRSIPFELWQEKTKKDRPEIIFENIRL